jgi:hypothetical protein
MVPRLHSLTPQEWQPPAPALKLVWSPLGVVIALFYVAATTYYFYVRAAFTLALGSTRWCVCACTSCGGLLSGPPRAYAHTLRLTCAGTVRSSLPQRWLAARQSCPTA